MWAAYTHTHKLILPGAVKLLISSCCATYWYPLQKSILEKNEHPPVSCIMLCTLCTGNGKSSVWLLTWRYSVQKRDVQCSSGTTVFGDAWANDDGLMIPAPSIPWILRFGHIFFSWDILQSPLRTTELPYTLKRTLIFYAAGGCGSRHISSDYNVGTASASFKVGCSRKGVPGRVSAYWVRVASPFQDVFTWKRFI